MLDLVGAVLVLAWWLAIPSNPFLLFGPGSAFLAPGPGLLASYMPVAILGALIVAARGVALWRPGYRVVVGLVSNLLGIAAMGAILWTGGPYIVAVAGANAPADLVRRDGLDRSVRRHGDCGRGRHHDDRHDQGRAAAVASATAGGCRGKRIDATRIASMTSAAASTSRPDV